MLLLTIFVIELAIGIYAVTNFSDLRSYIDKGLGQNFEKYGQEEEITKAFDALQKTVSE